MSAQVRTQVLDPGEELPANYLSPRPLEGECWAFERRYECGYTIFGSHDWQPVNISDTGSTWFCQRCRRIERREVVES